MKRSESERMREILIELQQAQYKEIELKKEAEVLFQASSCLAANNRISKAFEMLTGVLLRYFDADDSFILLEQQGFMVVSFSTNIDWIGEVISDNDFILKKLKKRVHFFYNVDEVLDWKESNVFKRENIKSAIVVNLSGLSVRAAMVFVSSEVGHFSKMHQRMIKTFLPVANQALKNFEMNQNLKNEIQERKRAENELVRLQNELVRNAYQEGFAENAISVLHNIGNLITPIRIKLEERDIRNVVDKLIKVFEIDNFSRLAKNMDQKDFVHRFQRAIIDDLELINQKCSANKHAVSEQIGKICDAISSQQKYANMKNRIRTKVDLSEIVNDAIKASKEIFNKLQCEVTTDIEDSLEVYVEPNGFHLTLVNIFTNSADSVQEKISSGGSKINSLHVEAKNNNGSIVLRISDTGVGFSQDKKSKLFNFGYTTKSKGSGFGLHSCANFIGGENGKLSIQSEGEGKGAEVEIILPLAA